MYCGLLGLLQTTFFPKLLVKRFPKIKSEDQKQFFHSVYWVNFSLRVRKIIFVVDNANSFTSRTGSSRVKQTPPTARFFNIWQPGAPIYQFYVHLNIKCCSVSFSAGRQLSVSFFLTLICLVATTYQNDFSYWSKYSYTTGIKVPALKAIKYSARHDLSKHIFQYLK